jgi:predicted site-specific integrase-resolvase
VGQSNTVSAAEVAVRLRVAPATVAGWRKQGIGPAYEVIGGRYRYLVADIERYIAESRVEPGKQSA